MAQVKSKALAKLGMVADDGLRDVTKNLLTEQNALPYDKYINFWESLSNPAFSSQYLIELINKLVELEKKSSKYAKKGCNIDILFLLLFISLFPPSFLFFCSLFDFL